jgi:hypothetical protein
MVQDGGRDPVIVVEDFIQRIATGNRRSRLRLDSSVEVFEFPAVVVGIMKFAPPYDLRVGVEDVKEERGATPHVAEDEDERLPGWNPDFRIHQNPVFMAFLF